MPNTYIIENVRDNNGEQHQIRVDICSICSFPIRDVGGHSSCIRQAREQEAMASMAWKKKQQIEIEKMFQDKPKTQRQIDQEAFDAETLRVRAAAQKEQRKRRLEDLEAEVKHLKMLIAKEEAKND